MSGASHTDPRGFWRWSDNADSSQSICQVIRTRLELIIINLYFCSREYDWPFRCILPRYQWLRSKCSFPAASTVSLRNLVSRRRENPLWWNRYCWYCLTCRVKPLRAKQASNWGVDRTRQERSCFDSKGLQCCRRGLCRWPWTAGASSWAAMTKWRRRRSTILSGNYSLSFSLSHRTGCSRAYDPCAARPV